MLTVRGIDNFVKVEPAEVAIANLALARQLANVHQDDGRFDTAFAILLQINSPGIHATATDL